MTCPASDITCPAPGITCPAGGMTCPASVSHWFGRPCSASTPLASRSPTGSLASRSREYAVYPQLASRSPTGSLASRSREYAVYPQLASRSPTGSLASRSRGIETPPSMRTCTVMYGHVQSCTLGSATILMVTRGKVHISGAVKGTRERFAAASLRRIFLALAHPPRGDFRQRGAVRHHERPRPALHLLSTMPLPPIRGRCRHRACRRRAGRSARAARPSPRRLHPPRTFPPQRQPMRYGFGGSGVRGGAPAATLYGIRAERSRRLAPRLRRLTVLTSLPSCRLRLIRGRVLSIPDARPLISHGRGRRRSVKAKAAAGGAKPPLRRAAVPRILPRRGRTTGERDASHPGAWMRPCL